MGRRTEMYLTGDDAIARLFNLMTRAANTHPASGSRYPCKRRPMGKTVTVFLSAPAHIGEGTPRRLESRHRPEAPPRARTLSPRTAPLAGRPLAPRQARQLLSASAEECIAGPPGPRHPVPFPFPVRHRALTVHLSGPYPGIPRRGLSVSRRKHPGVISRIRRFRWGIGEP